MTPETEFTPTRARPKERAISPGARIAGFPREKDQFAITIGLPPAEVYAFWRDLTNLPRFMKDLSGVSVLSPTRSEWTVTLKSGPSTSWLADIVRDEPGHLIAWESTEDSKVRTKGTVRFVEAPKGLGTTVLLSMNYRVPGGKATEFVTLLSGEDPRHLVETNLKRLKAYLETGEIPTTEDQPSGREEEAPALRH